VRKCGAIYNCREALSMRITVSISMPDGGSSKAQKIVPPPFPCPSGLFAGASTALRCACVAIRTFSLPPSLPPSFTRSLSLSVAVSLYPSRVQPFHTHTLSLMQYLSGSCLRICDYRGWFAPAAESNDNFGPPRTLNKLYN
jgi:hypothetical protein